jgi:hypothetical protein
LAEGLSQNANLQGPSSEQIPLRDHNSLRFALNKSVFVKIMVAERDRIHAKRRDAMRTLQSISLIAAVLVGITLGGCSAGVNQQVSSPCGADYTCLSNAALQYHQQAAQLSALAERYEIEANVKANQLGKDAEEVKRHRDLAQQYRSEADAADDLARQYRSQLPHNLVY